VFFGGDVLTTQDASRFQKLAPAATLVNFYGATETPQAMSYYVADVDDRARAAGNVPIGQGIDDVQLLVVNSYGDLCGIGESGEIWVRTPYLAKGYLGDERLSQTRFISNRCAEGQEDRIYKTGDRGRYLPDGNVEFLGRLDGQVKIRGFRVEPGEIEATLRQCPGVGRVAVMAREDVPGQKRLAAYFVADGDQTPTTSQLRRFLEAKLPEWMVPSAFVPLQTLPLTPRGKVDLKSLPVPDSARPELDETYVAPRTPIEGQLTEMWSKLLGIDRVGVEDSFFALGGHSLLAVQFVSRVRETFEVELPLRELFEQPTIAKLALAIEEAVDGRGPAGPTSTPPLEPVSQHRRQPTARDPPKAGGPVCRQRPE
jgi:non-ribosomal peptide synthetase component F